VTAEGPSFLGKTKKVWGSLNSRGLGCVLGIKEIPVIKKSKTRPQNPRTPRTRLAYKITITSGGLTIQSPPSGWLTADVVYEGKKQKVRGEITLKPDGKSSYFQLQATGLPNWLGKIIADLMATRWDEMQVKVLKDLRNG
jgi:hypothetical protein